jgi:hypothetical protein
MDVNASSKIHFLHRGGFSAKSVTTLRAEKRRCRAHTTMNKNKQNAQMLGTEPLTAPPAQMDGGAALGANLIQFGSPDFVR